MGELTKTAKVKRVTTTEGRQRLPDLIQTVYGEKSVVIFHRYGRDLAALVPLEMLPQQNEISLNIPRCSMCAIMFPHEFEADCHRPDCPGRAALNQAGEG